MTKVTEVWEEVWVMGRGARLMQKQQLSQKCSEEESRGWGLGKPREVEGEGDAIT